MRQDVWKKITIIKHQPNVQYILPGNKCISHASDGVKLFAICFAECCCVKYLCYVMLCCVVLCYVLCYVISCHVDVVYVPPCPLNTHRYLTHLPPDATRLFVVLMLGKLPSACKCLGNIKWHVLKVTFKWITAFISFKSCYNCH